MKTGLACIGLTTLDVVARAIDVLPKEEVTGLIEGIACAPAGTAAAPALLAARLGVPSRLISAVGDDLIGRFIRTALSDAGVDISDLEVLPGLPSSTTLLAVSSSGVRPGFHALGAGMLARVTPRALETAAAVGFLHYGGVGGPKLDGGEGEAIVRAASRAGAVVTCDLIAPQPSAIVSRSSASGGRNIAFTGTERTQSRSGTSSRMDRFSMSSFIGLFSVCWSS